ncbi:aspartate aminotransferase family protein [Helicobacter muridarum]|uniref:Acetylornithine aminotransferase n=1 Tax=Helicobacter muridarum TaxID=216 RepID=A0A377PW79_9HELI|nr:aspartate aminotransferase family protein [Helicobacter muridarum]TLD99549.1 aspartate aminotransferase family protein [Helicobacter muridarum]STQ85883.1 acetylornithine aminotransferase [Helicobacter muridarum]
MQQTQDSNHSELIAQAEKVLLKTYNRKLIIDRGNGVFLYDIDNNEYLDFGAGIAVCALGYQHKDLNEALYNQINKILHTSNLYYNVPAITAAKKLSEASGIEKIFWTNSGTEANEGAIKAAKKYAFLRDKHHKHNIIAFKNSFHGRSIGALSLTGNPVYQEPFKPLLDGVHFADFNEIASVERNIDSQTCAIFLETIQGEGGITPAKKDFLVKIRKICDENDILLVLDEIQCGMGRSGKMFAWQHYGIKPDIFSTAKALGCGLPVGAFGVNERVASSSLAEGDHGTTYGGNPLVCAGVNAVFDIFQKEKILANVESMSEYLINALDSIVEQYDILTKRQGLGLLQGVWIIEKYKNTDIISKALEQGLIILPAGDNSLRFAPPLIVQKEHIDMMIDKLKVVLDSID